MATPKFDSFYKFIAEQCVPFRTVEKTQRCKQITLMYFSNFCIKNRGAHALRALDPSHKVRQEINHGSDRTRFRAMRARAACNGGFFFKF